MLSDIYRLYHTVKFLKKEQIFYRLYYLLRGHYRRGFSLSPPLVKRVNSLYLLDLLPTIPAKKSYDQAGSFTFLNRTKNFEKIDWNFSEYGKLWTYNLTYFDFLLQEEMPKEEGIALMEDFINALATVRDGMEPFPISLRGINWIKFLSYHEIRHPKIEESLYAQYNQLMDHLEYHLLGNHLLENGFSLMFGAYYFRDKELYTCAEKILLRELNEQILSDGGHFERSPMYHQIMLFRLLDLINLLQHNPWKGSKHLPFFEDKAQQMLGWLWAMGFDNGDIPLFYDSAEGIAPRTKELLAYAMRLDLTPRWQTLGESGYRKIAEERYECVVSVGSIVADYIPGHAHADLFTFELRVDHQPFIVDTGLSTYEVGPRRDLERSTSAHNTVEVEGRNQSEVWGGFRVAKRASVVNVAEKEHWIEATHDGYAPVLHTRTWSFQPQRITIVDRLSQKGVKGVARLHFHPRIIREDILKVLSSTHEIHIEEYFYAPEFNILQPALRVSIPFEEHLEVELSF